MKGIILEPRCNLEYCQRNERIARKASKAVADDDFASWNQEHATGIEREREPIDNERPCFDSRGQVRRPCGP
jgi:hypothetical protein